MSERQELERAQRELELKQQLFEQQYVVDKATLEESVWQQAVNEDTNTRPNLRSYLYSQAHGTLKIMLFVTVGQNEQRTAYRSEATAITEAEVRPKVSKIDAQGNLSIDSKRVETFDVSSSDAALQQLATTLQEGFNRPKPEDLTLNGSSTDYC